MKKLVIVGKSASGKNTIASAFEKYGYKRAVTHTSRDPRPGEVDGTDYHFVDKDYFEGMIDSGQFIESDCLNDWYYGMSREEYEKSQMLILTPRGVRTMVRILGRDAFYILYVDAPSSVRVGRSLRRGDDQSEVSRRLGTDYVDFEDFIAKKDWNMYHESIDGEDPDFLLKKVLIECETI